MKKLFLLMAVCLPMFMFTACDGGSDDYGEQGEQGDSDGQLSGTKWTMTDMDIDINETYYQTTDVVLNIYFYSSKEVMIYYGRKDFYSDMGGSSDRFVSFYTYRVSGNRINLESITDDYFYFYSLTKNGNSITADGMTLNKSTMTSSDDNFINSLHSTTGSCKWYHNAKDELTICGPGQMADYTSYSQTPWSKNNRVPQTVIIEEDVTHIGNYAFASASVAYVKIRGGVESIGKAAFKNSCISTIDLTYVGTSLKDFGDEAFANCQYLARLSLPKGTETIGESAFYGCKSVWLYKTTSLKKIGDFAFMGCGVLDWTPSEVLEEIGTNACTDFTSSAIELPNSLKKIGHLVFSYDRMSEIRIGTNLKNITGTPFFPASSGKLYINQNNPPELSCDIINSDVVRNWTLYVPKGCKNGYSKAAYWKNFKSITETSELSGNGEEYEENTGDDEVYSGEHNGHKYVDLGLPSGLKWATCNVGASKPEEYGDYFAWGETKPKSRYDWDNCFDCLDSTGDRWGIYKIGGQTQITPTSGHDTARENWGGSWRMPTDAENDELCKKCTWTEGKKNGVIGCTVKGPNGNSIFLPAAGIRDGTRSYYVDDYGYYWSNMLSSSGPYHARGLYIPSCYPYTNYNSRKYGLSVRPVYK